ncbi:hypothetical protein Fmac_019766 [Flemingia macrophylla]|uniref:non-specific serine/threonine protein kinase n=1 Tax=Flemingia macrophylla TaxID=520843 RepID=A0ABD1M8T8_9FABA
MGEELEVEKLKAVKVLGKGAMGSVFMVEHKNSHVAVKVVDKTRDAAGGERGRWEMKVLTRLSHPFLPTLLGSFESDTLMGWAIPYCPGGDLNVLRYRQTDHVFSPAVIRFYAAEIICALRHLHSIGIAYRDLKPENVLIQQSGHLTLTDFDLSRTLTPKTIPNPTPKTDYINNVTGPHARPRRNFLCKSRTKPNATPKCARVSPVTRRKPSFCFDGERSNSFVGTEEYVAPEVVRGDGHEFAVDWWALGVLTYEMLYGTTPFKGKNRKETFRNVLLKPPEFVGGRRTALTDLIERLLQKDPTARLGYARGATEIMEHEFFRGLRWDLLTEVMRPPFIPSRDDDVVPSAAGLDIRAYFRTSKSPPSLPPSPTSVQFHKSPSLPEF